MASESAHLRSLLLLSSTYHFCIPTPGPVAGRLWRPEPEAHLLCAVATHRAQSSNPLLDGVGVRRTEGPPLGILHFAKYTELQVWRLRVHLVHPQYTEIVIAGSYSSHSSSSAPSGDQARRPARSAQLVHACLRKSCSVGDSGAPGSVYLEFGGRHL